MRAYHLESILSFGKHEGKTLRAVLEQDPSYVVWCFKNLSHFHIAREVMEAFSTLVPSYVVPGWLPEAWEIKQESIEKHFARKQEAAFRNNSRNDDHFDGESYGEYQGHYAQYEEGLSDDFINNVLEGDPDAYWNID